MIAIPPQFAPPEGYTHPERVENAARAVRRLAIAAQIEPGVALALAAWLEHNAVETRRINRIGRAVATVAEFAAVLSAVEAAAAKLPAPTHDMEV